MTWLHNARCAIYFPLSEPFWKRVYARFACFMFDDLAISPYSEGNAIKVYITCFKLNVKNKSLWVVEVICSAFLLSAIHYSLFLNLVFITIVGWQQLFFNLDTVCPNTRAMLAALFESEVHLIKISSASFHDKQFCVHTFSINSDSINSTNV